MNKTKKHAITEGELIITVSQHGGIPRICLDLPEVFDELLEALGGSGHYTEFVITNGGGQEQIDIPVAETNVGNGGEIMVGESRMRLLG